MTHPGLAAIVLAAGASSRMRRAKPLLSLGERTVLQQVVARFQSAGISDVRVVVGHHAERLAPVVRLSGAEPVVNPRYADGMFASVLAGVRALDSQCRGFFMMPVDVPLVRPATIRRLVEAWGAPGKGDAPEAGSPRTLLHPTFMGRRGHPPLIGAGHIPDILAWAGGGGLRACLSQWEACAREVPVADRFILADMDTPEDYRRMAEEVQKEGLPSPEECHALMTDILAVPSQVHRHCRAVAQVAVALGQALNGARDPDAGDGNLSLALIRAAALVHDLARDLPDHAREGAQFLRRMGFPAVADVVAVHMDLPENPGGRLTEADIVYLADKLVAGDALVGLEERFQRRKARFVGQPEARAAAGRRLARAMAVQAAVERAIGRSVASVLENLPL